MTHHSTVALPGNPDMSQYYPDTFDGSKNLHALPRQHWSSCSNRRLRITMRQESIDGLQYIPLHWTDCVTHYNTARRCLH
jgi:hypothetical protein